MYSLFRINCLTCIAILGRDSLMIAILGRDEFFLYGCPHVWYGKGMDSVSERIILNRSQNGASNFQESLFIQKMSHAITGKNDRSSWRKAIQNKITSAEGVSSGVSPSRNFVIIWELLM
jgi:hypothetical protein